MKIALTRFLIFLLSALLLVVPGYWISRKGDFPEISLFEQRDLTVFPEFGYKNIKITASLLKKGRFYDARVYFLDQFTMQLFQQAFVKASTDQFPNRVPFTRIAKLVDRSMIWMTYAFLPDQAVPTDTTSDIYITKDRMTTFRGITYYDQAVIESIDLRLKNIKDIKTRYPEINIYIFYFDNLANSKFDPRLSTFKDLDGGRALNYLEDNIPEGIHFGKLMLNNIDDQNAYYYHSDHHMNAHGAWRVYQSLYRMIEPNYPGISPEQDGIIIETKPDLLWLGTYARDSLYPFEPEPFELGYISLPRHTILHDLGGRLYNNSLDYLKGQYSRDPYIPHYQEFYGLNTGYVKYSFENDSSRNLLLFGSSHKIPIQPWIASHYKESYFINPQILTDFSLDTFLEKQPIDDLVILTNMSEILNESYFINP